MVALPSLPGAGSNVLTLDTPPFFVLLGLITLLVMMLIVLRLVHPKSRRAVEAYLEATEVDLVFLVLSVALVVGLVIQFPQANLSAYALYRVILDGYWLAFSIPIVTVGSSVHTRSKGGVPWLLPSIAVAVVLFVALFAMNAGVA